MASATHVTERLTVTRRRASARALATISCSCSRPAYAADPGAIVGVVTDAAHRPVPAATVTAVHAGDHAIRATVSHADGEYGFADLPPGSWALTWEAAGFTASRPVTLEVASGKATRQDVVMNASGGTSSAAPALAALAAPSAAAAAAAPARAAPTVPEALQAPAPAPPSTRRRRSRSGTSAG